MPVSDDRTDLDGDLMANPPLAELFLRFAEFRPSAAPDDEHVDDGRRGGCGCDDDDDEGSRIRRRLDVGAYADGPSVGNTVTTTDALVPPPPWWSLRGGIKGICSSSRSSRMAYARPGTLDDDANVTLRDGITATDDRPTSRPLFFAACGVTRVLPGTGGPTRGRSDGFGGVRGRRV